MKLLILCSLLSLLQTLTAVALIDISESEWQLFKENHKKTYKSFEHEAFRRKIFIENTVMINIHNKEFAQGRHSFRLAVNEYADLLNHEFRSQRNGYKMSLKANVSASEAVSFIGPNDDLQLPKVVDWRDNGAVTPVKNQGQCGSCWSFSATGSLEGQHYRKTGKLVSLSEQNLVDCSTSVGNDGCDGGLMDLAFKWIKQNGGIDTETSYPYKAEDGTCHYEAADRGATDKGYVDITKDSEHDLKKAVATIGPISVAIDASGPKFQFYSEGVYVDECSSEQLDHGVLVVGYGKDEETGMDYWLVKNSWGEGWGDQGYIKMARNHDNMCGIASSASYPLV